MRVLNLYNIEYTKARAYSKATLFQNFKAIGELLSEVLDFEQTNIYIFPYIYTLMVLFVY
jgi:hypothetical protein